VNSKILIFLIFLLIISSCTQNEEISKLCFEENCFELDMPKTEQEFLQGLMFREYLPENQGMLFIFKEPQKYAFWMKNTTIPLDIIWLDENFNVVYVQEAQPCEKEPCTIYVPDTDSLYVLEINQGLTKKLNITKGSNANYKVFKQS